MKDYKEHQNLKNNTLFSEEHKNEVLKRIRKYWLKRKAKYNIH